MCLSVYGWLTGLQAGCPRNWRSKKFIIGGLDANLRKNILKEFPGLVLTLRDTANKIIKSLKHAGCL